MGTIANHLLQSTIFAAAAGLLTLLLRNNHARTRYWIWLTASLKFLIPFSIFVELGHKLTWSTAPASSQPQLAFVVDEVTQPFEVPPVPIHIAATPLPILPAIWIAGSIAILIFWFIRWRRVAARLRAFDPQLEPGIFGIFRPVLYFPPGIADQLNDAQLKAIVAHELCHIRRRDNLTAALHMLVEAVFWFHPLVWWIGTRLVDERERACDEEVVQSGSDPEVYAESILKICKLYLESPLACVSGVTGSDLKKRIEAIMTNRVLPGLNPAKKLALAVAGLTALALPLAIGMLDVPAIRAQTVARPSTGPQFDAASVRLSDPKASPDVPRFLPGGRFTSANVTLHNVIRRVYEVDNFQLVGEPDWLDKERFVIEAKAPGPASDDELALMVQRLLEDRFRLRVHWDTKVMPVYNLTTDKDGPKLDATKDPSECSNRGCFSIGLGTLTARNATLARIARALGAIVGRPVVDKTQLAGGFDFKLHFDPDSISGPLAGGGQVEGEPSVFTAVQEQIGLRLEPQKGAVAILVIDHVERPSAN